MSARTDLAADEEAPAPPDGWPGTGRSVSLTERLWLPVLLCLVAVTVAAAGGALWSSVVRTAPVIVEQTLLHGDPGQVRDEAGSPVSLGLQFGVKTDGVVTGVRAFDPGGRLTGETAVVHHENGRELASATFADVPGSWAVARFADVVPTSAGEGYVASYTSTTGLRWVQDVPLRGRTSGDLRVLGTGAVIGAPRARPDQPSPGANHLVDVLFRPTGDERGSTQVRAAQPEPSGASQAPWPDAASTGVREGVRLGESGDLLVTDDGAVVEGLLVRGTITIRANDVQVRNVKVLGGWIDVGSEHSGTVISDTEIDGGGDAWRNGVGYRGYTCIRCDVHHVGRGFNAGGDVEVRDSWVHDVSVAGDSAGSGSHNEAVLSNGGSGIRLVDNRFDAGSAPNVSAVVALYGDFEPISDVLVLRNRLAGGGYCLYGGSSEGKPFPVATGVMVRGNVFATDEAPRCGYYGHATGFDPRTGTWEDNVWTDGDPVPAP